MLKTLDGQLKSLPATAQVAAQQGKYLGRLVLFLELLVLFLEH